jgi:hypothetical protein
MGKYTKILVCIRRKLGKIEALFQRCHTPAEGNEANQTALNFQDILSEIIANGTEHEKGLAVDYYARMLQLVRIEPFLCSTVKAGPAFGTFNDDS